MRLSFFAMSGCVVAFGWLGATVQASSLPEAETEQRFYCRGVIATTSNFAKDYLLSTWLQVEYGPPMGRGWDTFESEWVGTQITTQQAQAGCTDCLDEAAFPFRIKAMSEHFWQDLDYRGDLREYCPHATYFGLIMQGEYCRKLIGVGPPCQLM